MSRNKTSRKSRTSPVSDETQALAQTFTIRQQQVFTTSLDVAARFGKRHDTVLRAIRNLKCSEAFSRRNLAESDYTDERGKTQKSYELTRDGFTMLAFGFTGDDAVAWREKYITAFNWMEQELTRIKFQQQEPAWQQQRLEARVENKLMCETLQMVRADQGKDTAVHHYTNEQRLISFTLTGEFKPVDRTVLNAADLALLAKLELKNTVLIGRNMTYADRKATLQQYAIALRTPVQPALTRDYPPLALAA